MRGGRAVREAGLVPLTAAAGRGPARAGSPRKAGSGCRRSPGFPAAGEPGRPDLHQPCQHTPPPKSWPKRLKSPGDSGSQPRFSAAINGAETGRLLRWSPSAAGGTPRDHPPLSRGRRAGFSPVASGENFSGSVASLFCPGISSAEMPVSFFDRPILNSPYDYPARHWELDESGQPTDRVVQRRRLAQYVSPIPKPKKRLAE